MICINTRKSFYKKVCQFIIYELLALELRSTGNPQIVAVNCVKSLTFTCDHYSITGTQSV